MKYHAMNFMVGGSFALISIMLGYNFGTWQYWLINIPSALVIINLFHWLFPKLKNEILMKNRKKIDEELEDYWVEKEKRREVILLSEEKEEKLERDKLACNLYIYNKPIYNRVFLMTDGVTWCNNFKQNL